MALASLCSRISNSRNSFLAFIVDHGVRPGSADEATEVSIRLHTMGMYSSVLFEVILIDCYQVYHPAC